MNKQLLLGATLALLVGIVPLGFISQQARALDANLQTVTSIPDQVAKQATDTVEQTANNASHAANANADSHKQKNASSKDTSDTDSSVAADISQDNRLSDNKLRVCQKKEAQITSSIQKIGDRGAKQLNVFHTIAERTKTFYATKGYSISGYDELAQQVDTLYDQSLVAVTSTQSAADSWSCSGNNPTQALATLKDVKSTETATLKAYKDKVRALIILVKSGSGGAQ